MLLRTGGDPLSGLHADDRQVRRTPEDATTRIEYSYYLMAVAPGFR